MKRKGRLFDILISDTNLSKAIDAVNSTHRWKKGHKPNCCTLMVEKNKNRKIRELRDIITKGFTPKEYRITKLWDNNSKKERTIYVPAQWPDQYVHHALIQVLERTFMKGMDAYCCGSISKRGPHYAAKAISSWMKRDYKGTKYVLSLDIFHFYESIKSNVIMERMKHLIKDYRILAMIENIVKNGITIGSYTSQWFANVLLQPLDRIIRNSKLCKYYVRYMDNFTIFSGNKRHLRKLKEIINDWLKEHYLKLKDDWQIFNTSHRLPDAVGYRFGRGYILLRKRNLLKIKRGIAKCTKKLNSNKLISYKLATSVISRCGQLNHCNSYNIIKSIDPVVSKLKHIIRKKRKEEVKWNTYLAQQEILKS